MSDTEDLQSQPALNSVVGKKGGRPIKMGDNEWQDDEVFILIELWSQHECLFNSRDPQYVNKASRAKAIDRIIDGLQSENINVSNKQIQEKINKLRNYLEIIMGLSILIPFPIVIFYPARSFSFFPAFNVFVYITAAKAIIEQHKTSVTARSAMVLSLASNYVRMNGRSTQ